MKSKQWSVAAVVLTVLILAGLTGGLGLLVGRAQAPKPRPTLVPTMVWPEPQDTPTSTQAPVSTSGSISGRVWHDLCALAGGEGGIPVAPSGGCVLAPDGGYRANGLLETHEPGLGGVLVHLGVGTCPGVGTATTLTTMDGAFSFSGLSAGAYCVSIDALNPENAFLLPGGWTFPAATSDLGLAGISTNLLQDEQKTGIDFGWDYQFLPAAEPVASSTPAPTTPPTQTPTPVGCTDQASFVTDVTIPDNTRLLPGQSFIKTWRLRNSGTCTWTKDYALDFSGGDRLGAPNVVPLTGPVLPGQTIDLSVTLTAPTGYGNFESQWQLRNADGKRFGIGRNANGPFWVKVSVVPPSTATPTATPTPQVIAHWRGEYFANRDLTGNPVLVRDDKDLNFDWGNGAPTAGLPVDGFSARWSRSFSFSAGTYRFYTTSDDGIRVWLDGVLIIDQWHDTAAIAYAAERTLASGSHALRVEYYENGGLAKVRFWWERLNDVQQWSGAYYPNLNLSGAPALVRNDPDIRFDWGRGIPASGLPSDGFSVRWTRLLSFDEGIYRFHIVVDDGARLWVDDTLVVDGWVDGGRRELARDHRLSAGNHNVRVEFYERAGDASIQVWWEKIQVYPDWRGEYWPNLTLGGDPVLVRNDVNLDFNWGFGSPASNIPADAFSARWTRTYGFDAATYRFHVVVDDGARLWVDNQVVIDAWSDGAVRELTIDLPLSQGQHGIRMEFYERSREARVRLWWEKVTSVSYPDWKGEYWSNRNFSGTPAFVRNDRSVSFSWDSGPAAPGLPVDTFAVRWSRQLTFEPRVYRFNAWVDDGIRFYIDGRLLLDEWHDSSGEKVYAVDVPLTGPHQLVVEYYEHRGEAFIEFWWEQAGGYPSPTPTSTATPLPPTATSVPPTATPTATSIATATPTPTSTPTLVPPTPTSTPTLAPPTPTATSRPPIITPTLQLNEILTLPAAVDWNGDGQIDEMDQWLELYNGSAVTIELGDWVIVSGADAFTLDQDLALQPGALLVLFRNTTGISLNEEGGIVRLLDPSGREADRVAYVALLPDASYSLGQNEIWYADWPPSPNRPNSPTGPTLSLQPGQSIAR